MRLKYLPLIALVCMAAPALAEPDYAPAVRADYKQSLGATWDWFHTHPDLSFREIGTAARMAQELRAIPGMVVTEKVGGTGVVALLKNGDGPVVLMRADMDGLPLEEKSGVSHPSTVKQVDTDGVEKPVMHACGHDVHITSMIGTARRMAAMKDRWSGTVLFIVQPAEERVGGARKMLEDGLYTRFPKPDYAVAFHVAADLPTGTVSASEGIQYSSSDSVDMLVHGVGAHGASPNTGKDPIYIASQIIVALQAIDSREISPLKPVVVTVGSFHAGSKHNIISDRADLQLTLRANDEETRAKVVAAVKRIALGVARTNGVPENLLPEVTVVEGTPVTANDPALARRLNAALARDLGAAAVRPYEQTSMGAEDFAYFVTADQKIPGYYFSVGGTAQAALDAGKAGGPPVASHHSPLFRIDPEPSVVTGTIASTAVLLDLLAKK
jgi:amidohydrolase